MSWYKTDAPITSRESEGYNDFPDTFATNDFGYKFSLFPFLPKFNLTPVRKE
ncbi:MAG TPA: hypothetical protein VFE53_11340 [Mucilaginibacter sp.]|nr:hypothetical protein [Mucilaginibacter sp.]